MPRFLVMATVILVVGVACSTESSSTSTSSTSPPTTGTASSTTVPESATTVAISTTVGTIPAPTTTLPPPSTTSLAPVGDLESGLLCRDLAHLGYSYAEAVTYWTREGQPDRMDADRNSIPCETVYEHETVVEFWGDPPPTTTTTTLPGGPPSSSCVNGWTTPERGTALRTWPLDQLRGWFNQPDGLFVVDEMRHFVGPNSAETIAPRMTVDWWYVEAHLQSDPAIAGRWIYGFEEGRWTTDPPLSGHVGPWAEAEYGTTGFEPGVWTTYVGGDESGGPIPYDPFWAGPCTPERGPYCECPWGVLGCGCTSHEGKSAGEIILCSGPPPEVMGCLSGL